MSRDMTVKLSPYERAVNRLNDLPLELDRIFSEALEDLRRQRDEARAELQQEKAVAESAKERALSAEREVDAMLRVLNGYRSFPLPSAAMHAKQVLEQLEARIERLTLEAVQHESQLEEARASTESLTAEFQRAVADCDEARAIHQQDREGWAKTAERMETLMKSLTASRDEARAALSALDADGFAKFAAETTRASQLEAKLEREKASATRGWQTADELHLTVRDLKAEVERLRADRGATQNALLRTEPAYRVVCVCGAAEGQDLRNVAEAQREETLRSVFFKLKAALGAGKQQQALAAVIDAEREMPLVTEKP